MTEADEVTYNLHILLRYKFECLMITGEVKVADLPELWSSEMERLLGGRGCSRTSTGPTAASATSPLTR